MRPVDIHMNLKIDTDLRYPRVLGEGGHIGHGPPLYILVRKYIITQTIFTISEYA